MEEGGVKEAEMTVPGGRMDSFVAWEGAGRSNLCGRADPSRECAAGARRGCTEVAEMAKWMKGG